MSFQYARRQEGNERHIFITCYKPVIQLLELHVNICTLLTRYCKAGRQYWDQWRSFKWLHMQCKGRIYRHHILLLSSWRAVKSREARPSDSLPVLSTHLSNSLSSCHSEVLLGLLSGIFFRWKMTFYPYLLLTLSSFGMASNVASLFIFAKQKFRRNFHRLLVLLAIYDFMVSANWSWRKKRRPFKPFFLGCGVVCNALVLASNLARVRSLLLSLLGQFPFTHGPDCTNVLRVLHSCDVLGALRENLPSVKARLWLFQWWQVQSLSWAHHYFSNHLLHTKVLWSKPL